jgi:hypothetical protein
MTVRDGLLELGGVPAEAFQKTGLPMAPPAHPHEVVRGRQYEENYEQDVV